jgi:hypothetical protein
MAAGNASPVRNFAFLVQLIPDIPDKEDGGTCMGANTVDIGGGQPYRRQAELEAVARASIESQIGRTVDDLEWVRARTRLLEFAKILRNWGRRANMAESQLQKVA